MTHAMPWCGGWGLTLVVLRSRVLLVLCEGSNVGSNLCDPTNSLFREIKLILKVYGQNMRITFKRDSKEGAILERLGKRLVVQKLGVLRIDSEAEPIVIRLIPKEEPRP